MKTANNKYSENALILHEDGSMQSPYSRLFRLLNAQNA
jgi:hypothetical protein